MRIFIFSILFLLFATYQLDAQRWTNIDEKDVVTEGKRDIIPSKYLVFTVDDVELKELLWSAPKEAEILSGSNSTVILSIPLADGSYDEFSIYSYEMMEEALSSRYPDIKTFKGSSRTKQGRTIRMDYTNHGLRAVINDRGARTYIDHYQRDDKHTKIIYYREDYQVDKGWSCDVEHDKFKFEEKSQEGGELKTLGDCELRTYRHAQTTTGEYSNHHGATSAAQSALVLGAVTTTINRVNDIYEMDLSTRFVLIGNTDAIFYYDPITDPFDGSNSGTMINDNQTNTDAEIGSANYDIGHIFSTGGSGLAGLGVVCTGSKARGVTGISNPQADPFDIDYVAHEIGHQCAGNHTQNNNCNRSGNSVEVGSGYTIMGYAGICAPNVGSNSIAMFNGSNITEMSAFLNTASCAQTIALTNQAPTITAIEDKVIPASTPFLLYAPVSDADGDLLYYAWDQSDAEVAAMPPATTNTGGPTFRGFLPTVDTIRYLPRLQNLSAGTSDQWEVLPSVNRNMNFILTVRDQFESVGCIDTTTVTLEVDGTSGPFIVTSQNSTISIAEYDTLPVTWNVANTIGGLVDEKLVDILLSKDGGLTFPEVLATGRYNDGYESVVIPQGLNSDSRVMVKGNTNYFFNINSADFNITNSGAAYGISLSEYYKSLCNTTTYDVTINSESFEGLVGNIVLSVANLPVGMTSSFGQSTIAVGGSTTLTLGNYSALLGIFEIEIIGLSGGVTRTERLVLEIPSTSLITTLNSPADGAIDEISNPLLGWTLVANAIAYDYEIYNATTNILVESGQVSQAQKRVDAALAPNTSFSWKVRPVFECGIGMFTSTDTFTTNACFRYLQDMDVVIPTDISTVESVIDLPFSGTVTDVNIYSLSIDHSYISDLDIRLTSASNSEVLLFDNTCGSDDNLSLSYDDGAAGSPPCPPDDGGTYQPVGTLADQNSASMTGEWKLTISDVFAADGGMLNNWTLEVCYTSNCDLVVTKTSFDDGIGSLKDAIDCANPGDQITLSSSLANSTINLLNETLIISKGLSIVADPLDNITISGTSTASMFSLGAGINVNMTGFTMINTTTTTGVIENQGILSLDGMTITCGSGNDAVVSASGTLDIKANCSLGEN